MPVKRHQQSGAKRRKKRCKRSPCVTFSLLFRRQFHGDLASIEDAADFSRLQAVVSGITDPSVWIGLKRGEPNWSWSLSDSTFYGEGETEYRHWKTGQLDNLGGIENCAIVDDSGEFWDVSCSSQYMFICYDGKENAPQRYVFVSQAKSWRDAQMFCRENHTDLVSVRNLDENQLIKALVPKGAIVFIGLFKDFFRWSDNSISLFRRWSVGEPNDSGACVEQRLSDTNTWAVRNCDETRPFICQDGVKMQILKVKLKSGQNVNDPAMMVTFMEKIQQKLVSLGMPKDAKLQWRVQSDGEIFHLLENDMNSHK
ncbi:macrophage mannose receptor 1-like isoform X2 [Onychostoma macrolepis]|uniref:macrophage mannose receptor 1-like isoform X2 n=1 Tax=Onychostoma macrolepis TaxID=369639 RepID=UPI002729FE18|nr:macrophage mannose receptor 1-like isoform X2 [Onychostoma macrolepis]